MKYVVMRARATSCVFQSVWIEAPRQQTVCSGAPFLMAERGLTRNPCSGAPRPATLSTTAISDQ
jgi:hypothetical protein